MNLKGIHFLLSYRCTNECDHCFLWSSPRAKGTMTLQQVRDILEQGRDLGTVEGVYFEGGEAFLFYPIMIAGLRAAADMGLKTGIVTNCYWATSVDDAEEWLRPLVEIGVSDLSLSSDLFHGEERMTREADNARTAARRLGLPEGIITIDPPAGCEVGGDHDKGDPIVGGRVRFRGRAAVELIGDAEREPWSTFTECPDEDFLDPGRVHVDAMGNVHLCQGVLIGNLWERPLKEIVADYDPHAHPVIGPLLEGGPVALAERYGLPHEATYADACHFCYLARSALRERLPESLAPAVVYGEG